MKRPGNLIVMISGGLLVLVAASYASPEFRDSLIGLAGDALSLVRQFRDFVLELFART